MCKLSNISYIRTTLHEAEPVKHFCDKNGKITHIFAMNIIIDSFNGISGSNSCKVVKQQSAKDLKVQFQLLCKSTGSTPDDSRLPTIPEAVVDKLLTLLILADHGAWHFYNRQLVQKMNTTSEYSRRDRIDPKTHSHLQNKHVSLASIITEKPNYQVEKQMHDSGITNMIIKTSRAHDENDSDSDSDNDNLIAIE